MICELCGKDVPRLHRVVIEGVIMNVCSDCAKFGKEIKSGEVPKEVKYVPPEVVQERIERKRRRYARELEEEEVLVEDYPERIRNARQRLGLTQDELAKRILEKKTVISKIERGEMRPDDKLIKKLEKELGVKLKEKVTSTYRKEEKKPRAMTLGDLLSGAL